jgi:hypothetical protein
MDDEAALAAAFDEAEELALPRTDDEWESFNLTDVSAGNSAVRLLRRMAQNRKAVMAAADVDYARIDRVYKAKRAEVDQFVEDRLARQDEAEPLLMAKVVALAGRELDVRLAQSPRESKTVDFVGGRVASRKVGGQPQLLDRDAWLPWAVDHEEVNQESPCTLPFERLEQVVEQLRELDGYLWAEIQRREATSAQDADGHLVPGWPNTWDLERQREHVEWLLEEVAAAQAAGAKPVFAQWAERYYWFHGQDAKSDPNTGEVTEAVAPAWYPKGDLEPKPVPGVGRVEPGRNYTLTLDEE